MCVRVRRRPNPSTFCSEFLFCVTEFYVYLSTSGNAYIVCLIHAVYWEIFNNIRDSD